MIPPPLPPQPIPPIIANRFFNLQYIRCCELLPWKLKALGLPVDHRVFRLTGVLRFYSDIAGGVIVVPDEYLSDLASIPQPIEGAFLENDDPRIAAIAWIHDYICSQYDKSIHPPGVITLESGKSVTLTHTQAAQILAYEGMAQLGADTFQQDAVFNAVNDFGPQF